MAIGVITGTGTYALPGFEDARSDDVETRWGVASVTHGHFAGVEVLHVSRHGPGHPRLSNHVNHRANIAALRDRGARAAIGCVACGILEPAIEPGPLDLRPAVLRWDARGPPRGRRGGRPPRA